MNFPNTQTWSAEKTSWNISIIRNDMRKLSTRLWGQNASQSSWWKGCKCKWIGNCVWGWGLKSAKQQQSMHQSRSLNAVCRNVDDDKQQSIRKMWQQLDYRSKSHLPDCEALECEASRDRPMPPVNRKFTLDCDCQHVAILQHNQRYSWKIIQIRRILWED